MDIVSTTPNPELSVVEGNKSRWTHANHRRHGWHNLHRIARYTATFRAAEVMTLERRADHRIAGLDTVRHFTSLPWFSAMLVIRGQHVLFERYASDFGPDCPHSIQSITKTTLNLMVGRLAEEGLLDLSRTIGHYLPEIGSGYAHATVQQVLNMDVVNDYTEDFTDPAATYYRHEEAMGWRLPREAAQEQTQRRFLPGIASADVTNRSGRAQYKDANTDVLGWVVERVSQRPLRAFLADIVDAAGLEAALHITTDRDGWPALDGGACLTARDLARYFSLFVRRGRGLSGRQVGGGAFIEATLSGGVPMSAPYEGMRYSNHAMVNGRALGHAGWGGQFALAHLDTGTIGVFFSVIENEHATNHGYLPPIIQMFESIVARDP